MQYGEKQISGRELTVASSREEGHPIDGDGYSTMLVMEMMDVVGGAQAGRHSSIGCSVRQRGQQSQRKRQSPPRAKAQPGDSTKLPAQQHHLQPGAGGPTVGPSAHHLSNPLERVHLKREYPCLSLSTGQINNLVENRGLQFNNTQSLKAFTVGFQKKR